MGIDEARQEALSAEVNPFGTGGHCFQNFGEIADGYDLAGANGYGFGIWILRVGGEYFCVVQNAFIGCALRPGCLQEKGSCGEQSDAVKARDSSH